MFLEVVDPLLVAMRAFGWYDGSGTPGQIPPLPGPPLIMLAFRTVLGSFQGASTRHVVLDPGDDRGKARRFDRGIADRWRRGVTEGQSAA